MLSGGIRCCLWVTAATRHFPAARHRKRQAKAPEVQALPDRLAGRRMRHSSRGGFFHIDIAEVQTAEGKLFLFVGIDRTCKFAVTQLIDKADRKTA